MNNKTKQKQIREELQSMKITDSHCGLPFSMSDVQIDTIMAIFAREQEEVVKKVVEIIGSTKFSSPYDPGYEPQYKYSNAIVYRIDEEFHPERYVEQPKEDMNRDKYTTQLPEEKEA